MTQAVHPELVGVLARGKGATVEFKRSLTKDVDPTLCALANAEGGTVLIGVSDAGETVGVANRGREEVTSRHRASACVQGIIAPPAPSWEPRGGASTTGGRR